MTILLPALAHVASFGLASPDRPALDARYDEGLIGSLRASKITGLAQAAYRAGDLILDDEQATALAAAQTALAAVNLEIDALTLSALVDLGHEGLVVLKGMAHAHLEYSDPSLREYGDLDLYVERSRFEEVESWFAGRGFDRSFSVFAPAWASDFGKSVMLSSGALEVDLHRNLSQGLALGVRPDDVLAARTTIVIGGVVVPILEGPARLVHAAIHALGGSSTPPLTGLVDIAHMSSDPRRVRASLELAKVWDVAGTLADAIAAAAGALGGVPAASLSVVENERGSVNERIRRRVLESAGHEFRRDALTGLLSLRSVGTRARFVRSLATSIAIRR